MTVSDDHKKGTYTAIYEQSINGVRGQIAYPLSSKASTLVSTI